MPVDLIILIAALIVSWLVFTLLIKVVKASIGTAILIAAVVLVLQLFFGIDPQDLWQQITQLPQTILRMVTGN
ncbi:hypothetical protein [Coleofasciculus sp. FACHB-SPT36]|uniref:hypothetical protein n=1 Tax=Cyanophyceae TaxID=3028117 RepID=UPI00168B386A|nr:hypothetical protein [Coleofasciculus sp. FACHB-SPT36]MBD2538255.1 hypothetical protein [Coleofasciculus sp. FACHB-SPT36]